jgi:hypothetical protein
METLLRHPHLRQQLGAHGLKLAHSTLRIESRMEESVNLYREVVGPRAPRAPRSFRKRARRVAQRSLHAISLIAITFALWFATGMGTLTSFRSLTAIRFNDDFHLEGGVLAPRMANLDDYDGDDPADLIPGPDADDDDIVT